MYIMKWGMMSHWVTNENKNSRGIIPYLIEKFEKFGVFEFPIACTFPYRNSNNEIILNHECADDLNFVYWHLPTETDGIETVEFRFKNEYYLLLFKLKYL